MKSVFKIVYVFVIAIMLYKDIFTNVGEMTSKKRSKKIQFLVIVTVFERIIRNVVIRSSIIHELKCLKRFFFEKLSPIHIIVCGYHPKTEFQFSISKNIPKIRLKTLWNLPYNKEFSHFDNLGSLRFSDDSCGQLESSRYLTEKVWDAILNQKVIQFLSDVHPFELRNKII